MAGHKGDAIFLSSLYHLITVVIGEGNGLFAENILMVFGGTDYGVLVEVVGSGHHDNVHILPAAEGVQISLHLAAQLLGDGLRIIRIQNGDQLCPVHFLDDTAQLRAEIAGTHNCVADGLHTFSP